jgi:hypothetical protein
VTTAYGGFRIHSAGQNPVVYATEQAKSPHLFSLFHTTARSGRIEPFIRRHGRACPGHPRLSSCESVRKTWMPATSAGMTLERWFDFIGMRCSSKLRPPRERRTSEAGRSDL